MGARLEIGWTAPGPEGGKRHVCARRFGGQWTFFERPRRKGAEIQWQPIAEPTLDDWLELLDSIERRAARDLHPPEEIAKIRRAIREQFPDFSPDASS